MTVKSDVSFRISGPCLSLLLRDCECSVSDQMGFLIGEKSIIKTQIVSDEEMEEEKIDTTITVNGTFPVGLPFVFCSPLGRVNEKALREILGSCEKNVVGWYSFRRNSNHGPSLRETLLHRELCKVLRHTPPEFFIFLIITASASHRNATLFYRFTFSTLIHRKFQPVPVAETNLGEPEDSMYRRSTTVDKSFKHLQQVFRSLNGVSNSKSAMTTLLSEVDKHVSTLETSVARLQADVDLRLQGIGSTSYNCAVSDQKTSRGDGSKPSTSSKVEPNELSAEY